MSVPCAALKCFFKLNFRENGPPQKSHLYIFTRSLWISLIYWWRVFLFLNKSPHVSQIISLFSSPNGYDQFLNLLGIFIRRPALVRITGLSGVRVLRVWWLLRSSPAPARSLSARVYDFVISGFRDLSVFFNLHGSSEQGRYQALGHFDARNFPRLYSLKFLVDFVLFFLCGMALNYQHVQSMVLKSLNAEFGKGCYVLLSSKVQSSFAKVSVLFPSFVWVGIVAPHLPLLSFVQ